MTYMRLRRTASVAMAFAAFAGHVDAQSSDMPGIDRVSTAVHQAFFRMTRSLIGVLPALATAAIILILFWAIASLTRRVTREGARFIRDPTVKMLVSHVAYYCVWAIGVVVMLDALGMNFQSVATALGLGGIAVGFALKDILSNLVSGILILAMRPFALGDQIVIGDTEGTVEQIELRATQIRTYDGRLVLVPNGDVFTSRITNNTASPVRRASVYVYLGYKEDLGRAFSIILDTVKSVRGVTEIPAPSIRLRELTPEAVVVEARLWADSHRANLMDTASAARVAIVQALRAAGINLPDGSQRVVTVANSPVQNPLAVSPGGNQR